MRILCVAEKPSIAKSISAILASGNPLSNRPGKDQYCRNYDFEYRMPPGRPFRSGRGAGDEWTEMTVTSVKGHLMGSDFPDAFRKWTACSPADLFTAPIESFVSPDCKKVAHNLKLEARSADVLMIWTDCDREGEHIGAEVVKVCRQVKPSIEVKRARFSAIIANQIHRAAQNPVELDWRAAEAVESRIELDLRLGAAFTRLQCLNLQPACQLDKQLISYGPCQFPTLGFVVDRYIVARDFVPEPFWYIAVMDKREEMKVDFRWSQTHLFNQQEVRTIYQRCRANPEATVVKVVAKETRKFKPSPLTTVELQKSAGRLLRMAPKRVLDIAERLYQQGILSYPRTETDQYDKAFDFHTLINKHLNDSRWGPFASRLADPSSGAFERPVNGQKNDKAHPPIHPTRSAPDLTGDDARVYEYITRRFLASCNKHAIGKQTTIDLDIAKETFTASGIIVVQRNYLDVYTYDKWGGPALPEYHQNERFVPTKMEMKAGETTRPKLLTEADLVSLMDRNGIGTDATIAEHIAKIIDREYVKLLKEGQVNYLIPSELGMGLVEGYNAIEFSGNQSLCKPLLRRETEERMNLICEGVKTREETVRQSLAEYRVVYDKTADNMRKLIDRVSANLRGEYLHAAPGASAVVEGSPDPPAEAARPPEADVSDTSAARSALSGNRNRGAAPSPAIVVLDDDDDDDEYEDGDESFIRGLASIDDETEADAADFDSMPNSRATSSRGRGSTRSRASTAAPRAASRRGSRGGTTTSRGSRGPTASSRSTNVPSTTSNDVCFTCQQPGHWSSDCPTKASGSGSRSRLQAVSSDRQNTSTSDRGCFKCGKDGHWASNCNEEAEGPSTKRQRVINRGTTIRRPRGRGRGS